MIPSLSPGQQNAFDRVVGSLATTRVAGVSAVPGFGRTTVLRALHAKYGGAYVGASDFLDGLQGAQPLAIEEMLYALIMSRLADADYVFVDDFHLLAHATVLHHVYPRGHFLSAVVSSISAFAEAASRTVVFGMEGQSRRVLFPRIDVAVIPDFTPDDFAHICSAWLPPEVHARLDFRRVHRYAAKVTAHQLRRTCEAIVDLGGEVDTESFVAHLGEYHLSSNVRLAEVQDVDLADLRGMDEMLEALEAGIVFPMEHADLASRLKLRPKRGVLIAGPPGTGKTTVGRALARRLRGKFFILDGTVISGGPEFYERVQRIFALAKQNAPAIIFIDDSDVIFEASNETGLYRYLLTMLDGLESESPGQICVMMTAMDVGNMPPALVRSGRIDLWLETRLPDGAARAQILRDRCVDLPAEFGEVEVDRIAELTEGLTGADLRMMVEEGKLTYAYDLARGLTPKLLTDYIVTAMETVQENKQRYARAEARAVQRNPGRPAHFNPREARVS